MVYGAEKILETLISAVLEITVDIKLRCSHSMSYALWALLDCKLESVQHLLDLLYVSELIGVGMNRMGCYCWKDPTVWQ